MKAILILPAIAVGIWAIPYIRCFFKRIRLAIKLTAVCRKCGFKTYAPHPMWFLGGKLGGKFDLYLERGREFFAIKLFGTKKYTSELIFTHDGKYLVRNFIAVFSGGGAVRMPVESKPHDLRQYTVSRRKHFSLQSKIVRRVLIVNPVCYELKYREKNGKERIVNTGESINGMEIYSLTRFCEELERIYDRTRTY